MKHSVNYEHPNNKMHVQYNYYVMGHVRKPVFIFWLNGQVHVFQQVTVQSAMGNLGVSISLQHMY